MPVVATPQLLRSKLIRAQLPHEKQVQQSPLLKIFDNLSGAASEESLLLSLTNFVWFGVSLKVMKMESIRKLSNFNFQWTKSCTRIIERCNKSSVKFHKKCDNRGKILNISCVRCNFVKFHIHFLGLP